MADITISTNSKTLNEVAGNNGAIANTITFKAAGGTFAGDNGDALGTITGVPEGLTAVLVKTSATTAKLVLKGTATAHNDLANAAANGTADDTPAATRAEADAVGGKAVNTITLSGKYEAGDKITVSGINNETVYTVEADDVKADDAAATLAAIATKLAAQINGTTLPFTVTATADAGVVTLTTKEDAASLDASVDVTNANADNANGLTVTFASDDFATGDFPAAGLVVDDIDFKFVDPAEAGTLTLVPPEGADTTGVYSAGSKTNTVENLPTISGTGKAGDKIYIYSNGGTKPLDATKAVTVDENGKWELDLSVLKDKFKDGAHVVTASTSIDGKGAMSAPFAFTVDSKAPSAPSVTAIKGAISDVTPVLTGKAEKFATVKVYSSETQSEATLLGTTTANAKGVWTLAVTGNQLVVEDPKANNQTFKISALAIDAAGNSTKSKKPVDLTIDTKIATPTLEATTAPKKNTVVLKGNVEGETGGTLQLYGGEDGSVALGKVIKIAKDGSWKSSIKLTDGVHKLSVVATDAAGNVSDNSVIDDKTTVTIDTFTATPTLELDKDGSGNVIGVKGTAEAGAKVKITIGKKTLEAEALADGTWSKSFDGFTPDSTTKVQTIKAVATDTATNVSKPSVAVTHTFTEATGGGDTFTVTDASITPSDKDTSHTYTEGDTITLKFSQAIDATKIVIGDLALSNTHSFGTGATLTPTTGTGTDFVITLGTAPTVAKDDTITIAAAKLVDGSGTASSAGVTFTVGAVETTPPAAADNGTLTQADSNTTADVGDALVFTFSEAIGNKVAVETFFTGNATYGASGTAATTAWTVNDTVLTVTLGAGETYDTGTAITITGVQDLAGNSADLAFSFTEAAGGGDTFTVTDASITPSDEDTSHTYTAGDTITLKFSQAIDATKIVIGDLALSNTHSFGTGATLTPTTGTGTDFVITLGTAPTVAKDDTITIAAAKLVDGSGTASSAGVTFTVGAVETTPPAAANNGTLTQADANTTADAGDALVFTFSEAIGNKATVEAFFTGDTAYGASGTAATTAWTDNDTVLTVTLGTGETYDAGTEITITGVQDLAGNSADLAFSFA